MFFRALLLLFWFSAVAHAADLTVAVRSADGMPIDDAVITVSGAGKPPAKFDQPLQVSQKDLQFHPFVLVVPRGSTVSFPNLDKTRHHVYSFSPAGPFELKLYAAGEARTVRFDKVGTIAIGCNIHDQMSAFIRVTDDPYAAVTDKAGVAVLRDIPPGAHTVSIWHPLQKGAPDAVLTRSLTVAATGASLSASLETRKSLVRHSHY